MSQYPQAILFDLDGTLIDSAPDIASAVNELLSTRGLPALELPRVIAMIGNGMEKLVERAFRASGMELDAARLSQAQQDMLPIYLRHTTKLTTFYPGVRQALETFHAAGVKMAIVTNKPQKATDDIVTHFGLGHLFGAVLGAGSVPNRKPAPDMLYAALEKLGVPASQAIMVGDSDSDAGAGHAADMPVVMVRGGYTHTPVDQLGAALVLDGVGELPAALTKGALRETA